MSFSQFIQERWGNPGLVVTGMYDTIGVHTLIPAPGVNNNINVQGFHLQSEESQVTHTVFVRVGVDPGNEIWRLRLVNDGDGEMFFIPTGTVLRLGANKPLSLVLAAKAQVGYNIVYYID